MEGAEDDELHEVQTIRVDPGQKPVRIDKFVTDKLPRISRNRVQNAIRAGTILVDDRPVKPNHKLSPGERISIVLPRATASDGEGVEPQDIPLDIRYEDDSLLVVYKPPGMVVHPGIGNPDQTLVNALAWHHLRFAGPPPRKLTTRKNDLPVMEGNAPNRPGLVHRIDKDTSGLLVVAKTETAMSHLARQFFNHSIERSYQAVVWGAPEPASGTLDRPIGRHPRQRQLYTTFEEPTEAAKEAVTHYRTLEDLYYVSLVELKLETGRTHQIRVHMSGAGHPVFSDAKYGGARIVKGTVYSKYRSFVERNFALCPRQALHAKSLGFVHPTTGERVFFDSELPEDITAMLDRWRHYLSHRRPDELA